MTDPRTVRLVALLIGLVALASVLGGIALMATDRPADAALFGLGGTALGYLAGLTSNASRDQDPQPVTVRQPAGEPVPVEDA